ncbi:hypothetical protein [Bosea sp. PAMC 26642]|uniref:hypothetical protein n=1 Tax=Bosea sp. (strain PAMC 26642) TaxID=1792307 RepID=UPI0012E84C31|nr:hypothetical protein [Bosea sp. PAMC 26642]
MHRHEPFRAGAKLNPGWNRHVLGGEAGGKSDRTTVWIQQTLVGISPRGAAHRSGKAFNAGLVRLGFHLDTSNPQSEERGECSRRARVVPSTASAGGIDLSAQVDRPAFRDACGKS